MAKRSLLALALLAAVGCAEPADSLENLPVHPGWGLTTVNGAFLPVPEGNDGSLQSAGLIFREYTVTGPGQGRGVVTYARHVRRNGLMERSIVDHDFTIGGGSLRINLCPRLAVCIALVAIELVGPVIGGTAPLILTEYLGGQAGPVLRFDAALAL
ncbi:MAG: hypothetical protein ACKVZ0_12465 [Gemmatimonadales bacterium]